MVQNPTTERKLLGSAPTVSFEKSNCMLPSGARPACACASCTAAVVKLAGRYSSWSGTRAGVNQSHPRPTAPAIAIAPAVRVVIVHLLLVRIGARVFASFRRQPTTRPQRQTAL